MPDPSFEQYVREQLSSLPEDLAFVLIVLGVCVFVFGFGR